MVTPCSTGQARSAAALRRVQTARVLRRRPAFDFFRAAPGVGQLGLQLWVRRLTGLSSHQLRQSLPQAVSGGMQVGDSSAAG